MIVIDGYGWACTDCIILVANGDAPCDLDEHDLAEYLGRVAHRTDGLHVIPGDDYDSFSWSPCDVCGSNLGGERHQVWFAAS